ncbi:sorting nexin-19 isoform X2 [Alosa sapidissima]|uniref:sorting nexin-19 isoform X2 n=1 Tax=Alosa sapidissima TaxID=34773 RepID=UPI001C0A191C|nr:sorting nexin-19 isoform X2 [Alosa sapidissima]
MRGSIMSSPAGLASQSWGLVDMLGQRRLLGVGAFLAWMILFHLLVNVWLLCIFTSFLVVLGAWLGSQVILESNRVVHLERFVTMERISSSVESEQLLDREIENTVTKIIRDFVSSWYSTVSPEHEFENEVERAMISMAMELKLRSKRVDTKALTQRTLDLFGCHLQSYMRAKENLVDAQNQQDDNSRDIMWKLYSKESTPHPALKSSAVEVNYARAIVDLLLHVLVPAPHLETRTGRFVVGELITCNVLLPLITKLSDPDWLNMMIVEIFAKAVDPVPKPTGTEEILHLETPPEPTPAQETEAHPVPKVPEKSNGPSKADVPAAETPTADVVDSAENCSHQNADEDSSRPVTDLTAAGLAPILVRRPMDFLRPGKSNPFYHENDSDQDSPLSELKKNSTESLVLISPIFELADKPKEDVAEAALEGIVDLEDELSEFSGMSELSCPKVLVSDDPRASVADVGKIEEASSFCTLHELEEEGPVGSKAALGVDQQQVAGMAVSPNELAVMAPLLASSPTGGSFTFDPLSSPEGPVIIQNLRITGTIIAKEHRGTGSHPYTLYTVKYETALDSDNPCAVQPVAYHMVNRRYSEFLNLQTRLEEKPELRKIIKNVKGPKKIFPDLPFGNMDTDKIEARKSLLENFLKQLCAIPETANSDEMQEFLALNTDARIAFVKKPFIVSRIDKIVMNAIVDTLKTAFPRSELQSPTDDVEVETDGKLTSDKKSKSRLRFSSKTAPALIVTDIMPKVLYCFDEASTVFNGLSVAGLETFIQEQEILVVKTSLQETGSKGEGGLKLNMEGQDCGRSRTLSSVLETAVGDVALDVLCMLMKDQWSWLCTENIQRTLHLLFGTFIDRWLEVKVCNLTCTQYWVTYLRVLQEAVWPGGRLPVLPRPQRSLQEREETRRQSLHCLMKLLPDLVSDLLGSERYRLSWTTVLDSLQDPHINRHLVYSIWDLLLEFLIPEVSEEAFQKSLLHSLSKNADKLLP